MIETQEQLIRSINQQLENLMSLDEGLSEKYDSYFYYPGTDYEPIVERFTSELLKELENIVYELDKYTSGMCAITAESLSL